MNFEGNNSFSSSSSFGLERERYIVSMRVLVAAANGSEDLECVAAVDVLRRASLRVVVASVESSTALLLSRGTRLTADAVLDDLADSADIEAVLLPGGMPGAERLARHGGLDRLLRRLRREGKLVAAICAAPAVVLEAKGLLPGRATCFPAMKEKLGAKYCDCRVVVEDRVVTSQGPGTAVEFALQVVCELSGREKAQQVAKQMLVQF